MCAILFAVHDLTVNKNLKLIQVMKILETEYSEILNILLNSKFGMYKCAFIKKELIWYGIDLHTDDCNILDYMH